MTSDIPLAFDSLQARALADAGPDPLDRISLSEHVVEVEIGAFQVERGKKQRVRFDVVVEVAPSDASLTDDVDKILSYDNITEAISAELGAARLNLLETLAERIAGRILEKPKAEKVYVRIQKLDRGPGALGVEIVRNAARTPATTPPDEDATARPVVVYFPNRAIASPLLKGWLDELEGLGCPSVICVGLPDTELPHTRSREAQDRVRLLAIEQNAWALSSRDDRCIVVAARTELDWGLKNDQISVWAPSRMFFEALSRPATDAPELAGWLAAQLGADELVMVGTRPPAAPAVPVRECGLESAALFDVARA